MNRILLFLLIAPVMALAQRPTIESKGLVVDTVFFIVQDEYVTTNEFSTGTRVTCVLSGLKGLSIKDGMSFPGLNMKVVNTKGEAVLQFDDLFEEYKDGVDSEDARTLSMMLMVGSPMIEGEQYTWQGRVWDKNGKSELTVSYPVKVIAAKDMIGIKSVSKGLTFKNIYIVDDAPLRTNVVAVGTKITFVLMGIAGYTPDAANLVNIGMQVLVRDAEGVNLMEYSDLFKNYGAVDADKANTLTSYLTIGDPLLPGKTYTWYIKVWDKGTNKYLETTAMIEVVE